MLFHAQVHKDPLPQKTEAVGKISYEQGSYQNLIQVSWKTSSDFKTDFVNKYPFLVCTATHIGGKELDNKGNVRKGFR